MAKKGSNSGGFGGIGGSGIFGLFGTTVNCSADDESFYCSVMKLFNLLVVFLLFFYILYFVHINLIEPFIFKRKGGVKSRK